MNPETLLLRQVHPAFIQDSFISFQTFSITSQLFKPTQKDQGKLSVYNGEKFTAISSFCHFVQNPVCQSAGVIAVTMQECEKENLPVDYTNLTGNQIAKKAKRLRNIAVQSGWLFKV